MSTEAAEELLRLLESGRLPPADVLILDHMKTLLLLQDTERLTSALKMFPEHCMMPPGKHHSAYPSGSGCKTTLKKQNPQRKGLRALLTGIKRCLTTYPETDTPSDIWPSS